MRDVCHLVSEEIVEYKHLLGLTEYVQGNALVELSQKMARIHNLAAEKIAKEKNISLKEARHLFSIMVRTGWRFQSNLPDLGCQVVITENGNMFLGQTVCILGGDGDEPAPSLSEQELNSYLDEDYPFLERVEAFMKAENLKGKKVVRQAGSYHETFIQVGYLLDTESTAFAVEKYYEYRDIFDDPVSSAYKAGRKEEES